MKKFLLAALVVCCLLVPRSAFAQQTDPNGHTWWQHAVFYEVYPRSFADSNGDGIGDLNGVTSKLDYLHNLGIDAIWITPCFPSPQVDFGYDVSDYEAIDPMYGTLKDFDRLVAEARKRNIKVIQAYLEALGSWPFRFGPSRANYAEASEREGAVLHLCRNRYARPRRGDHDSTQAHAPCHRIRAPAVGPCQGNPATAALCSIENAGSESEIIGAWAS